jgi:hypothetical protein
VDLYILLWGEAMLPLSLSLLLFNCIVSPQEVALSKEGLLNAGFNTRCKLVKEMGKPVIRVLVAEDHPVVADGIMAVLAKAKDIVVVGQVFLEA